MTSTAISDDAVAFLAGWPTAHIHLTAIDPNNGGIVGHSFPKDGGGIAAALKAMQRATKSGRGLYFNPNDLAQPLDSKAKPKAAERDVSLLCAFHVDADVDKSITDAAAFEIAKADLLERIKAKSPLPPSVIIDSGNGFGVFWLLSDPVPVTDANRGLFKRINIALRDAIGGVDHCENLDRVMRVPFTTNFPNEAKRKRGRKVVPTRLLFDDRDLGALYTVDMFEPAPESAAEPDADIEAIDIPDSVDFGRLNDPDFVALLKDGPKDGQKFGDGSRSDFTYAMACELRRAGFSDGEIVWTITNPDLEVAAHILDQKQRDPVAQAMRVIARMDKEGATAGTFTKADLAETAEAVASAEAQLQAISDRKRATWAMLKRDWVYVANQEVFIRRGDRKALMYPVRAFGNMFAYLKRDLETQLTLTNYIFTRQPGQGLDTFESFCYMPGQSENYEGNLNLWRPSLTVPKKGDVSWFIDHVRWLFGEDDAEKALNWCGWVYRFQHLHPKHALLTHGEIQGTGKSVIANVMRRILGPHNCTIMDQAALDLDHDGWKVRTKLLIIEEVRPAFGSSNALMRKLHPLISEDSVHVDMKNKNDFDMPNVIASLEGSNKPDALSMDDSDRRTMVISTDRNGKILRPKPQAYYRTIYGTDGKGGFLNDPNALAAVAWELQHRDLKGYSAQDRAPATVAKTRMIEAGATELQRWLVEDSDLSAHTLVAVDRLIATVPADIERRHKGNLRNDVATILRRKFNGHKVPSQIRVRGSKLRVFTIGKNAEVQSKLSSAQLAEIWHKEYGAGDDGDFAD